MRKLGADWYRNQEAQAAEDLRGGNQTNHVVKAFGWPADGGVWVLKMPYMDSEMKGIGRIRNAFSMEERCRQIEKLGGVFYNDPAKSPDLNLA